MNDIILYAKSKNQFGQVTLLQHLLDTEKAVNEVFKDGSRLCKAWIRFFQIEQNQEKLLWKTLRVAALLHDIGKANEDFQQAVSHPGSVTQSIRHEHLSALILCSPEIREWLKNGGVDPDIVIAAVLSHHIKAAIVDENYKWCQSKSGKNFVKLYLNNSDIINVFYKVSEIFGLKYIPELPKNIWSNKEPWVTFYNNGLDNGNNLNDLIKHDLIKRRLLLAVKAGLIVADSVASAIVRERKSMLDWLNNNIHTNPISSDEIENAILKPRANEIENKTGKKFLLHNFQKLAGEEGDRTLLIAPCGAGKTIAAWQWAKQRAEQREFGRVIFLYPTRGTATEGFRDYVGWAPEGESTLLHSSSEFELESMNNNPSDSIRNKDLFKNEGEDRMFALGLWKFRYFSATVDQFLSFMQNNYKGLCLLPALADSVVILDEVHSYDSTMLEMLTTLLKEFNVPILCMTATLPPNKMERLLSTGLVKFPRQEQLIEMKDLIDIADCPRYDISYQENSSEAIKIGIEEYKKGKKVLIVVNRVKRCLEVADILIDLSIFPMVYHSRFRLMDRQDRHRDVIDAFKENIASIAVTTQVCEMSLDLDADVLISEVAPVPSLIQRLGRANRHLKNKSKLANVIIYPPAKVLPYSKEEIKIGTKFVNTVIGKRSQSELALILENKEFNIIEFNLNYDGSFINGGYYALTKSFRDEDNFGCVPCICDGDLEEVTKLLLHKIPIDGFVVPAPRNKTIDIITKLPKYMSIVPSKFYTKKRGLRIQ